MPLSSKALRRLSDLMRSIGRDVYARPDGKNQRYMEYLKGLDYDPRVSDADFEAMREWAVNPYLLNNETKLDLFDRYRLALPKEWLFRGEGMRTGRFGMKDDGALDDFAPVSLSPDVARKFAKARAMDSGLPGIMARIRAQGDGVNALPLLPSNEAELVLHPNTKRFLSDDPVKPLGGKGLETRLYYLRKKRGGRVNANH